MIRDATASRITLTDDDIETSETLCGLLDGIIGMQTFINIHLLHDNGSEIIKFARKYEFVRYISTIRSQLRVSMRDCAAQVYVRYFAIELKDYEMFAELISNTPIWAWWDDEDGGMESTSNKAQGWVMDPTALGLPYLRSIPYEILWAWLRSYHTEVVGRSSTKHASSRGEAMSKEFLRLMRLP